MKFQAILPKERLLPLMQDLTLRQLAQVVILMSDLACVLAPSVEQVNWVLNCIGNQIADHLSDEDTKTFRRLLLERGECREVSEKQ
jgi:hypothetical protein